MTPECKAQGERYLDYLRTIMEDGVTVSPRGSEIKEVSDLQLVCDARYPFMAFNKRKYPIQYCKDEVKWFLTANSRNVDIMSKAKMWASVQNSDGTFGSNYGQYFFGDQHGALNIALELIRDPDSRRAVCPMLSTKHLTPETNDVVCTLGVGFRVRDGRLLMSALMRSSDEIYGLGSDIGCFLFLYRIVAGLIKPHFTDEIFNGSLTITVISGHLYKKHYQLVTDVLDEGIDGFQEILMPYPVDGEAMWLIAKRGKMTDIPENYRLARWLEGV